MADNFTTETAATYLGVSRARVRKLIKDGRLPAEKRGRDHIIQESDPAKLAIIRSDELLEHEVEQHKDKIQKEEDKKIEEILRCSDCGELQIKLKRIEGKPGYVITQFARENEADLLVLNSPDRKMNILDRVFPHDIEHALADLPCNLLIVNPKKDEDDNVA